MSKYTFYEDPGHGWLEVPMAELTSLGVADKITPCSYRDGDKAYLEEDCDMAVFMAAKIYSWVPKDWKDAFAKLNRDAATDWFTSNVKVNDRATLRGAREIWILRLPNYYH